MNTEIEHKKKRLAASCKMSTMKINLTNNDPDWPQLHHLWSPQTSDHDQSTIKISKPNSFNRKRVWFQEILIILMSNCSCPPLLTMTDSLLWRLWYLPMTVFIAIPAFIIRRWSSTTSSFLYKFLINKIKCFTSWFND